MNAQVDVNLWIIKNKHPTCSSNTKQHSIPSKTHHPWSWFLPEHEPGFGHRHQTSWDSQLVPEPVQSNKVWEGMLQRQI